MMLDQCSSPSLPTHFGQSLSRVLIDILRPYRCSTSRTDASHDNCHARHGFRVQGSGPRDDNDVYYCIGERLKLERETENMGVCTKEWEGHDSRKGSGLWAQGSGFRVYCVGIK